MSQLLPPNSTIFERNVSKIASRNSTLPVEIASIARIDDVADGFLPFLAWQYSVDSWDNQWQPSPQRSLVKKSLRQHQFKGTIAAVRQVLEQFGYSATFTEWYQTAPQGVAGSFTLEVELNGREMSEAIYAELNRLIKDAKPASRHLANMTILVRPICTPRAACGVHSADITTIIV